MEKENSRILVLGSQSPRRKDLLSRLDIPFKVHPSPFEEDVLGIQLKKDRVDPSEYVKRMALEKSAALSKELTETYRKFWCLTSDTVVVLKEAILEKPKDKNHAFQMLSGLQGEIHTVFTGVSIRNESGEGEEFYGSTSVSIGPLTDSEIWSYIDTGEPMDKAGAYGIQGIGLRMVDSINGSYSNVMGLPLFEVYERLKRFL